MRTPAWAAHGAVLAVSTCLFESLCVIVASVAGQGAQSVRQIVVWQPPNMLDVSRL
jgi:hypothetical protein